MGKKDLLKLTLACWLALIGWVNSGWASDVADRCQQLCKNGQYEQAFPVCSKAAEHGDATAQCCLGVMYFHGKGVRQDDVEAVKWFRKAAEQGDATAQCNLGVMYAYGKGVQLDYTEAEKWYRKAAEQGYADAQTRLGVMYANDGRIIQDYEAAKWFRKAAELGYADAQFNLGVMYDSGKGVRQDYAEAAKWYRKAAEQGYADAQFNLAVRYTNGEGMPQSGAAATDWYYKAGLSYLKEGKKDDALRCAEHIKDLKNVLHLTVPNAFLADKLLTAIYGNKEGQTPITSDAKQRVTVGGKTVVVDSIRLLEDQFELVYNGRVLKGPADQLSAVIAAIATQEQENNRNQEVSKPKKKKRSKQANKTTSKALKPTDIKIEIKYDEFKKITTYVSPRYRISVEPLVYDVIFLRAWKFDNTNRITYQIYISSSYRQGSWRSYKYAHDIDGNSLELIPLDTEVMHRYSGIYLFTEHVGISVTEDYLQERKDRGLKLKISGNGGEEVFSLPAEYISAFLRAIERHANG